MRTIIKPSHLHHFFLRTILLIATASLVNLPQLVIAQTNQNSAIQSTIYYDPPTPDPPNQGEPGGRGQGGGQRGCDVVALVPLTQATNQASAWGLTTSDRPTFWFHLQRPQSAMSDINVELSLQKRDQPGTNAQTNLTLPKVQPGVISFAAPTSLTVNQPYQWSLKVYCNQDEQFVQAQGTIRRVNLSSTAQQQLKTAKNPVEKAVIYAKNGIWFDALNTLANQVQTTQDRNAIVAWRDLLNQVNLGKSASAPIVPCCTNQ
jgi:hypothetical protein